MKESVVSKGKPFRKVVCGYDPTQVDSYLFEIENKIRAYAANESRISTALINAEDAAQEIKNKAEAEAFKLLSEAKASSANAESRANDIVLKAKKEAAEQLNEASKKISEAEDNLQAKALQIISEANAKAEKIVADAKKQANKIISDTKKQADEIAAEHENYISSHDKLYKGLEETSKTVIDIFKKQTEVFKRLKKIAEKKGTISEDLLEHSDNTSADEV